MIISASYRTDIPAFYREWFVNRLDAGRCTVANPYGGPAYDVSLAPESVDGIVFWTRNAAPFAAGFGKTGALGLPFVVQFSLTGYPRALEPSVIRADEAIAQMRSLSRNFGGRSVVWRYDPILFTSLTPPDWHARNFDELAGRLEGVCDEVIVSFAQIYRKTRINTDKAAAGQGFTWRDAGASEKTDLLARLVPVAGDHGMRLSLCSQPEFLIPGAYPARCVDAARLADIAARPIEAPEKGNRPGCRCHESRDIGAYDSCPHGCVFCYAVSSKTRAVRHLREHDPKTDMLRGKGRSR